MGTESGAMVESIGREECLELLSTQSVGRLGVVVDAHPLIFPVNYVLDADAIIFRTSIGTKFTHSSLDRVAFEVDEVDSARKEGWSVAIEGTGRDVTTAIDERSERERGLAIDTWVSGEHEHVVRIVIATIEGRRIVHQAK